jgi:hypothetical protein
VYSSIVAEEVKSNCGKFGQLINSD